MSLPIEFFEKFILDRRGATSIEYALIGSLIAVVIIAAISATGDSVEGVYSTITTAIVDSEN